MANFEWTTGKPTTLTPTYVTKPIINEKEPQSKTVTYLDCINIGTFRNFGYLNNSTNFSKDFVEFINSLNSHFMDMDSRITNIENNINSLTNNE